MEECGKVFYGLGIVGFFLYTIVTAVMSLPNPLAIIWLVVLTVGFTASYTAK
jgi:hypothetical protein|tara:strand:- start:154 stop:309 length:156 start_codon:yes stop_codon:yes gene_type:complete